MPSSLPRIAAFVVSAVLLAGPADAKVSPGRAQQLCQTAIKVLQPPPRMSQLDKREPPAATSDKVTVTFLAVSADDVAVKVICTVDRETSMATVTVVTPPAVSAAPPP